MSTLHVSYNETDRVYVVHTDEKTQPIIEFNDQHKAVAFMVAVRDLHVFEDIKRMIKNYPVLEARAWRGAMLYLDDHVSKRDDRYRVLSQPGTTSYHVSSDLHCTCPDHANRAPQLPGGVRYCKHVIATVLFYRYHLKPKEVAANFRGRVVVQEVNGNGANPVFGNGERIDENHIAQARLYKEMLGRWPYNQEKLMSWVYR
jgi:hypothetical protein